MVKKKILFVSINRHQKSYFTTIGDYLSKDYDVRLVNYNIRDYLDKLLPTAENYPEALTPAILDKIIHFSQKKVKLELILIGSVNFCMTKTS